MTNLITLDAVKDGLSCPHCKKELVEKLDYENENPTGPEDLKCPHTKYIGYDTVGVTYLSDDLIKELEEEYEVSVNDFDVTIYDRKNDEFLDHFDLHKVIKNKSISHYLIEEKAAGGPSGSTIDIYYGIEK